MCFQLAAEARDEHDRRGAGSNSKVEMRYRQTSDGPSWNECQVQQEGQQRKSEDYQEARRSVEVQTDR